MCLPWSRSEVSALLLVSCQIHWPGAAMRCSAQVQKQPPARPPLCPRCTPRCCAACRTAHPPAKWVSPPGDHSWQVASKCEVLLLSGASERCEWPEPLPLLHAATLPRLERLHAPLPPKLLYQPCLPRQCCRAHSRPRVRMGTSAGEIVRLLLGHTSPPAQSTTPAGSPHPPLPPPSAPPPARLGADQRGQKRKAQ